MPLISSTTPEEVCVRVIQLTSWLNGTNTYLTTKNAFFILGAPEHNQCSMFMERVIIKSAST